MSEYDRRDIEDLGEYYMRHVSAMTGERLHEKSDIAAELAWRDREIDKHEKLLVDINAVCDRGLAYVEEVKQAVAAAEVEARKVVSDLQKQVQSLTSGIMADRAEIERLRNAIRKHRDQRGDDRCWMDDEELYKALPEGYTPPTRDSAVELQQCEKFIQCRHNPATEYVSPQREIERLQEENTRLVERSVGAMAIAEGDEGWENIPASCPMLVAVIELRKHFDTTRK